MKKTHLFITGASGFIGNHLIDSLSQESDILISALTRNISRDQNCSWSKSITLVTSIDQINNVDCVVHLAARVHQMKEKIKNPLDIKSVISEVNFRECYFAENASKNDPFLGNKKFDAANTQKIFRRYFIR